MTHKQRKQSKLLIIGIGNQYRRDDGVGLLIAHILKEQKLPHTHICEASGEGAALMEAWRGADTVILIDAVLSGAPPGTIHHLDAHAQSIPTNFFSYSTHAFSVAEAIELARILNCLPPRLLLIGIEGQDFAYGMGLSPEVDEAVARVVHSIKASTYHSLPLLPEA